MVNSTGFAALVVAQGAVGGVMAVLQGGKFGHGFMSAGFSKLASPFLPDTGLKFNQYDIGQMFAAAVTGGTASQLSGGKFANGAITGAFVNLFNQQRFDEDLEPIPDEQVLELKLSGKIKHGSNMSVTPDGVEFSVDLRGVAKAKITPEGVKIEMYKKIGLGERSVEGKVGILAAQRPKIYAGGEVCGGNYCANATVLGDISAAIHNSSTLIINAVIADYQSQIEYMGGFDD